MKLLIIGAKGFIGSHLVDYFTKQGHVVISCDVKESDGNPSYFMVDKFDSDYTEIFNSHKPDACIFAGGNGSVPLSLENPELDYYLNVTNVFRILKTIAEYNPTCKFIHLSSAAVYGNPIRLPITEDSTVQPLSAYGWHKYLSEIICKEFNSLKNIPTCSLRVFSVYGERLRKQLFWDVYQKTKKSLTLELFGTGLESRDFIYVFDLAIAIECVLNAGSFSGDVINVSSGIETTIEEAAKCFLNHYNPSVNTTFNQHTKVGDPSNWRADISKLTSLGFKYSISLDQGLSRYSIWLKENESH